MKKLLIPITLSLATVMLVVIGVSYWNSLHRVSFTLENTSSITIFNSEGKELNRLSSNSDIRLQSGDYYVIPEGEDISNDKISFSVKDEDKTVNINPPFSDEYLNNLIEDEIKDIQQAISSRYTEVFKSYSLNKGTLYQRGDWFGGLLSPNVSSSRQRDPYRIVLHKKDGEWQVVRRPEYILTASRYSEVPIEVLRQINRIVP